MQYLKRLVATGLLLLPASVATAATYNGASLDGRELACKASVSGPDKVLHEYDAAVVFDGDSALVAFAGLRWGIKLMDGTVDDLHEIDGYFIDQDGTGYYVSLDCSAAAN